MPGRLRRGKALGALLVALALAAPATADEGFWVERSARERHAALVARARDLLEQNNAAAAETLLIEAVELDSRDADAFFLLGQAQFRLQAWNGCADALGSVVRLEPGYAPSPVSRDAPPPPTFDDMLGLCLALSGRLDAAVAHYRRMIAAGASSGASLDVLHGILGDCYLALGRLDEAIDEYLAGIALAPRRASLLFSLAVAYDRDERSERARDAMERALGIDPQMAELTSTASTFIPPADLGYYRGLAHAISGVWASGNRPLAIAWFRKYLADMPEGPWVARAREHLRALGDATLGPTEVGVLPPDAPDAAAVTRAIVSAGGEVGSCLEPGSRAVVRAALSIPAATRGSRTPATVALASIGPDRAASQALDCIEKKLMSLHIPVRQLTRATVVIGAR